MMTRSLALGTMLVATACTPTASPSERSSRAAEAPEQAEPEPAPESAPDAVAPTQPEIVIGVVRPARIGAKARKANREGLKLHAAHDYDGSRAAFAEAVAVQPEHDMARFNLACALARSGRYAEATEQLVEVLTRDPVRFRQRARDDADLDALRRSPEWKAVENHLDRVEIALERALARGVPSMFFDHTPPYASWGMSQEGGTRNLVLGVYLHDASRFVPVARGGEAGYVDAERRRVVRIESVVWEDVVHSMWRSSKLFVTSFDPDDPFAAVAELDTDGPIAVGKPDLMKHAGNTGFEMSMVMVPQDHGLWLDLEWHTQGGEPYSRRTALELGPAGLTRTTRAMPDKGARIDFTYEGAVIYDPLPPGHRAERRDYHLPGRTEPIQLGRGHAHARWQSVALTADGRFAIVTSIEQREGPHIDDTGYGILRHAVDRVDVSSGEVTTLAEGRGTARTIIAPDGAVYVQGGDEVRRWPRADAAQPEAVTEGLRLAPPLDPIDCGLCG